MQGYIDAQKGRGVGIKRDHLFFNLQIKQKGCTPYSTSWTGRLNFQPIFVHGDEVLNQELEK